MVELVHHTAGHLPELYVPYGLAFIIFAVVLLASPADHGLPGVLADRVYLAAFGLLHGSFALWEAWRLLHGPLPGWASWVAAAALLASFLPLAEIARRRLAARRPRLFAPWSHLLPLAVIGLAASTARDPAVGLADASRLVLALPGSLGTALSLLGTARAQRRQDEDRASGALAAAAACFLTFAILAAIAVDPGTFPWLSTAQDIASVPSAAVPALSGIVGAALAGCFVVVLQRLRQAGQAERLRALELARANAMELERLVEARTRALSESEDRLNRAQQVAHVGSWHQRLASPLQEYSDEVYRIFGREPGGPASVDRFRPYVHPDDLPVMDAAWRAALKQGEFDLEFRILVDGEEKWIRARAEFQRDATGRAVEAIGTAQDITERKAAEQQLQVSVQQLRDAERRQRELAALARREQGRMSALLSAMSIGILFEDRNGCIEYVNPAFIKMWGIDPDLDLAGEPTRSVLEHSTHRLARADHATRHVLRVLDTHELSERFEVDLMDGRIFTQLSYPVDDPDGRTLGRMWIYEDITRERQTAQQLIYLAERDALTGLYNRHRFQERLDEMVRAARRARSRFALLYFDVDDFKQINDGFGHRAGDTVLVRTAGELSSMLRAGELFARLGGDEFAVLCTVSDGGEVAALAGRLVATVAAIPFRFRGQNIRVTTSVGVAMFPEHGDSTEDMVVHADMAMYQAKAQGKNTWSLFDPAQSDEPRTNARTTWSRRIEQALASDGVIVHFQGVYHCASGGISHLEALARMRDPQVPDRLVLPGQFVPFAERTGQVVALDRQVMTTVVGMLAANPAMPPVAVNVSGRSFDDPALPHFIRTLLMDHGVAPERLLVELTETAAVSDIQDAQRFIEALQGLGCQVCLDDFGSGFSSFAYLKYVRADVLKIDSLFIRDLPSHRDNQVFVRAMVDVARGLRMRTVAEGVETREAMDLVRALGVDMAQGYHLDRPQADHPALRS